MDESSQRLILTSALPKSPFQGTTATPGILARSQTPSAIPPRDSNEEPLPAPATALVSSLHLPALVPKAVTGLFHRDGDGSGKSPRGQHGKATNTLRTQGACRNVPPLPSHNAGENVRCQEREVGALTYGAPALFTGSGGQEKGSERRVGFQAAERAPRPAQRSSGTAAATELKALLALVIPARKSFAAGPAHGAVRSRGLGKPPALETGAR